MAHLILVWKELSAGQLMRWLSLGQVYVRLPPSQLCVSQSQEEENMAEGEQFSSVRDLGSERHCDCSNYCQRVSDMSKFSHICLKRKAKTSGLSSSTRTNMDYLISRTLWADPFLNYSRHHLKGPRGQENG